MLVPLSLRTKLARQVKLVMILITLSIISLPGSTKLVV